MHWGRKVITKNGHVNGTLKCHLSKYNNDKNVENPPIKPLLKKKNGKNDKHDKNDQPPTHQMTIRFYCNIVVPISYLPCLLWPERVGKHLYPPPTHPNLKCIYILGGGGKTPNQVPPKFFHKFTFYCTFSLKRIFTALCLHKFTFYSTFSLKLIFTAPFFPKKSTFYNTFFFRKSQFSTRYIFKKVNFLQSLSFLQKKNYILHHYFFKKSTFFRLFPPSSQHLQYLSSNNTPFKSLFLPKLIHLSTSLFFQKSQLSKNLHVIALIFQKSRLFTPLFFKSTTFPGEKVL